MPYQKYRRTSKRASPTKTMLQAIWSEGGRVPDMSRMERKKRGYFTRVFAALVVFFGLLAGVSWLGLFLTQGNVESEGITLQIDTPQTLNNFDEISLAVRYQNHDASPLAAATVDLRIPPEIRITEASPKADNESFSRWSLGSLEKNREGLITLKGRVLGTIGKKLTLQAILAYRPANFNSDFQTVETKELTIADSPISLTPSAPEDIVSGELVNFSVVAENTGKETLNDIRLSLDAPEAFVVSASEPALDAEKTLTLKTLKPGEKKTLKISGAFAPEAEGAYPLTVRAIKADGDRLVILKEASPSITVKRNNLITRLFVNERAEDQQIRPGDTLQVRVDISNQTGSDAEGLTLEVASDSPLIDWSKVAVEPKGKISPAALSWDAKSFPKLAKIKTGETVHLSFELPVGAAKAGADMVRLSAAASVHKIGGREVQNEIRSQELRLRVGSDLKLSAAARFYADKKTAVGSGPIPPEVGKETRYRITWRLSNTLHELSSITVTSSLPSAIRFDGKKAATGGTLAFDPATRNLTWSLERIGTEGKPDEIQFDVILTPVETDRGKPALLIGESSAEATDAILQTKIAARAGSLTTNLDGDPVAEGKGAVK